MSNPHVRASKGGDADVMKFYITEYSTRFDRSDIPDFVPR